jgi:hypothetical protein
VRYFHFALRERQDIIALVEPMLGLKWYRNSLQTVYPDLALPAAAPSAWQAAIVAVNPWPVCDTRLDAPRALDCHK